LRDEPEHNWARGIRRWRCRAEANTVEDTGLLIDLLSSSSSSLSALPARCRRNAEPGWRQRIASGSLIADCTYGLARVQRLSPRYVLVKTVLPAAPKEAICVAQNL
jgi:hypothetical protein